MGKILHRYFCGTIFLDMGAITIFLLVSVQYAACQQISCELGQSNPTQTGKLKTFADLVNRVVVWQTTDGMVPNSQFSPN